MLTVDDMLSIAFRNAVSRVWKKALPKRKYKKRIKNREVLYKEKIRLGKVKKLRKGGR